VRVSVCLRTSGEFCGRAHKTRRACSPANCNKNACLRFLFNFLITPQASTLSTRLSPSSSSTQLDSTSLNSTQLNSTPLNHTNKHHLASKLAHPQPERQIARHHLPTQNLSSQTQLVPACNSSATKPTDETRSTQTFQIAPKSTQHLQPTHPQPAYMIKTQFQQKIRQQVIATKRPRLPHASACNKAYRSKSLN